MSEPDRIKEIGQAVFDTILKAVLWGCLLTAIVGATVATVNVIRESRAVRNEPKQTRAEAQAICAAINKQAGCDKCRVFRRADGSFAHWVNPNPCFPSTPDLEVSK
jgi:hypothetical protein